MAEMQQTVARQIVVAPQTPAAPGITPPPPGQITVVSGQPSPLIDLSKYTVTQLRRMLSELRDQRQQLASRREGISGNYESTTGANREGIGERPIGGVVARRDGDAERLAVRPRAEHGGQFEGGVGVHAA